MSTAAVTSTRDTGGARPVTRASRTGVDRRAMAMLSAGHLFTDVGQGSIPALLPFLIVKDHLSYAGASALILAATIASSVIQPVFGHLSDRRSLPWLMPLGPILGGVGVALAAIAPSYALTFAAVVLSGIGVAAFHPEGSRFANYVSGAKRSSGMSLFSVGGNIGFALGPALITPLVLAFGLSGTLLVIIPTSLMGVVLARELPRLKTFRVDLTKRHAVTGADAGRVAAVHAAGRGHRAALVRLLRVRHLHPALLHPRSAHGQGRRGGRAHRDARRRGHRDPGRRAAWPTASGAARC